MTSKKESNSLKIYFSTYFHQLASFSWENAKNFAEKKQQIPPNLQVNRCSLEWMT